MYRSTISASVSAPFSRILSMNVTICSRKAAEELLRTDTLSRTAASPSLPTTAITPTKWCITRSWTHWQSKTQ